MKKRIRELLKEGKKFESLYFNLYVNKREDLKIGFIVNSKIGNPVKRNKAKRIIREIIRKNFKKGDFLFLLKKEAIETEKENIENFFENIKNEISAIFN
ncbi:MAG: ribonuclease P protein component [Candidatus Omnitrophica bacterium]|nr:ribonuclease P protein component [Candidatus Omnitrophota bacterium]